MTKQQAVTIKQQFAEWLTTPPEYRKPKTQTELAKQLGVPLPRLSGWKNTASFQKMVRELSGRVWEDVLPHVVHHLVVQCREGHRWAFELFFQGAGVFPMTNANTPATPAQGWGALTPVERQNAQAELMERLGVTPTATITADTFTK